MGSLTVSERQDQQLTAWHACDLNEVERSLQTNPQGLSQIDAAGRLTRFGPNQLEEVPMPGMLALVLRQVRSTLIYLLIVAAIASFVLREVIDAEVIVLVIVLDMVIGVFQERKAEISVRALAHLVAPRVRVIRGGLSTDVESKDLEPGDLVLLASGVRAPADIRLALATSLMVDESMLTGESLPLFKVPDPLDAELALADRRNMVFSGTTVTSGRERGYVVATGAASEIGEIATEVQSERTVQTLLQHRLAHLGRIISVVVVLAGLSVPGIGVLMGYGIGDMLLVEVAAAVSAVPEGLPVAFTITLAVGVRRMARRNAIVRHLPAVETLGSTSVIGSDKTGTLTVNRMTVVSIWAGGSTYTVPTHGDVSDIVQLQRMGGPLSLTLLAGVLANEAEIFETPDGYEKKGDPTEAALLVVANRLGIDPESTREQLPIVMELPFEPERQYSASVRRHGERQVMYVKGAPERVHLMCDTLEAHEGKTPIDRSLVHQAADRFAARGLRLLVMASGDVDSRSDKCDCMADPTGLTFPGLQGMLDPPREGVRDAIVGCQNAGYAW